jgi:hypothetical protein
MSPYALGYGLCPSPDIPHYHLRIFPEFPAFPLSQQYITMIINMIYVYWRPFYGGAVPDAVLCKTYDKQISSYWTLLRLLIKSTMHKLQHYGIIGKSVRWTQNWLENRTQSVVIAIHLPIVPAYLDLFVEFQHCCCWILSGTLLCHWSSTNSLTVDVSLDWRSVM